MIGKRKENPWTDATMSEQRAQINIIAQQGGVIVEICNCDSEYTASVEMLSQKMVSGSLQIDLGNEWKAV